MVDEWHWTRWAYQAENDRSAKNLEKPTEGESYWLHFFLHIVVLGCWGTLVCLVLPERRGREPGSCCCAGWICCHAV